VSVLEPVAAQMRNRPLKTAGTYRRAAWLAALVIGLGFAVTTHRFLTVANAKAIMTSASTVGILALGLTFIVLAGGLVSLAIASTAVVAAMVFLHALGLGLVAALALAVLLGMLITAAQGLLIGALSANPIVLTIGASFLIDSIGEKLSHGGIVQPAAGGFAALNGTALGIPISVYLLLAAAALFELLMRRTVLGHQLLLVGENRAAARAAGLPVARIIVWAFALAGAAFGLGGALLGAYNNGASQLLEGTLTFDAIAAVLVGGNLISGGRGSPLRTLGGAVVIATLSDMLLLRGLGTGGQLLLKGILVIAVVVSMHLRFSGTGTRS
jgi:ribose/xylose/arabinose/galactoside ABC-type transport system permease subunit